MEQTMISAFSQPLVSVLLSKFVEDAVSVVHFKNNFHAICEELEFVRMVVDSMSNSQDTSNSMKNWLQRLQKTLEDAEELVDECNSGDIAFHNFIQRYRLARRIKGLTKRIKGLKKDASVVSLMCQMRRMNGPAEPQNQNQNKVWPNRSARLRTAATAFPTILEPYTVGIETNVRALHRFLMQSGTTNIIGVSGIGGAGKTHLLQKLVTCEGIQETSGGLVIWLTISQNPVVQKLQAMLCRQMDLDLDEVASEEESRFEIYAFLKDKKFLMILDDVWSGGERIVEQLTRFCDSVKGKFIISSRDHSVLRRMGANHIMRVEPLTEEQSWEMFRYYAFRGFEEIDQVEETAKSVAKECKGLPLAIKTIAVAMVGEGDHRQWRLALDQLRNTDRNFYSTRPQAETELFAKLRLSYNALPLCLQPCFLYCAALPEDEEMDTEYLIQLWIAEGLLGSATGNRSCSDVEEIGRHYLNILIDNCLIDIASKDWEGRVVSCKMHDVLRDMAIYIAEEEERCLFRAGMNSNTLPLHLFQGRRRISLVRNNISSLPERFHYPKLATLLLRDNRCLKQVPNEFLTNLPCLRILDLSWTDLQSLPESIGCLKNLVSLKLSRTKIRRLPRSVKNLRRLQIIDLSACWKLEYLPSVMGDLKCMEHMNLSWCWNLRYLPRSLSELTSLLSLNLYNCSNLTWGHEQRAPEENSRSEEHKMRLSDLCNMWHLRHLDIDCRKEVGVPEQLMGTLMEMRTLRLNMRKLGALPEGMRGMANLEILRLSVRDLQQLPTWTSQFTNLRWLELSYCQNIKQLPRLERMPQLRRLQIEHCSNLTELGSNFGCADAFPTLEVLWLVGLDKLEELPALESGSMARLRVLRIIRCNNIRRLPEGIDRLSSLRILDLSHSSELIRSNNWVSQADTGTSENWASIRRLPQHVHIHTHSREQTGSLDCIR